MNYISLGYDCSPATALKNLNLRTCSLPFDWVQTTPNQLYLCIKEDFSRFHTNLRLSPNKKRIIDDYGIQYPHDYPTNKNYESNYTCTDDWNEDLIVDNWQEFIAEVSLKYQRRIARIISKFNDVVPLTILYRGNTNDANQIKMLLQDKFKRKNLYFVVATTEKSSPYKDIIVCNPEKNNEWNDHLIWKEGIDELNTTLLQNKQTSTMFLLSKNKRRVAMSMIYIT